MGHGQTRTNTDQNQCSSGFTPHLHGKWVQVSVSKVLAVVPDFYGEYCIMVGSAFRLSTPYPVHSAG